LILLAASPQYSVLPRLVIVLLVYLACLGGLVCCQLAQRGRPSYWLGVAGSILLIFGILLGRGYVSSGATYAATALGIALLIFAAAIDLIFGPPFISSAEGPTDQ
jgi:drug/metabolite transporter superfamily protein YnfA